MFNSEQLDELSKKILAILPIDLHRAQMNIKEQIKEILQSACTKLNLVARDEFDIQTKVLARTREKVDLLTTQLQQLTKDMHKPT